ncbi:MAG: hypothetical protein ABJE10_03925 [bacterium]
MSLSVGLVAIVDGPAMAQNVRLEQGTPLEPNGNGVPALRTFITNAFDSISVQAALTMIAVHARINITFDPTLPGIDARITIPAHDRTAATALLEIARVTRFRINVLPSGQVVVLPAAPVRASAHPPSDSAAAESIQKLPVIRTEAARQERLSFGVLPSVGTLSVSGRDVAPASHYLAQADLLRSVQLLPGIEARNDYSAGLNVRGGEADQNLILLDGYPIYNPFHLGGLFGTFMEPMVGRADVYTGGFPARFDGRLSSVLDVRSAEETRSALHGTAEVSLLSTTMSLGSAVNGGRGSWMIAGRRTYADAVAALAKQVVPYHFGDAQVHFTHLLPGDARIALTAYTGLDVIGVYNFTDRYSVNWGNRLLGGTLTKSFPNGLSLLGHQMGDSTRVEQQASISRFGIDAKIASNSTTVSNEANDFRVAGALSSYTPAHVRSVGYEVASQQLTYNSSELLPLFPNSAYAQRNVSGSVYYDDVWRASQKLIVEAGGRVDALAESHWVGVLPRLSVKYLINDNVAVTGAFGDYAQWVRSLSREDVPLRITDFWIGSDSIFPVSRARHYVLGLERWVNPHRTFRVEGFYKIYRDLLEPNPRDDANRPGDEFLPLAGRAYGGDFILRQFESGRFSGWASYTYTVSTRTQPDGYRFFPSQDRRHDLNLVGNWRSDSYALSMRFNAASGTPYTNVLDEYYRRTYDPTTQAYRPFTRDYAYVTGPRDGERLPFAHRLDVSLTKSGHIGGAAVSPFLSIVNIYNAKNAFGYGFDYTASPPKRYSLPQFSFLPTFGATVSW